MRRARAGPTTGCPTWRACCGFRAHRTSRTRPTRKTSPSTRTTDRRYNLSDFEEFLDDAAIPDPEAEEKAAREWAERFADKPLVINPTRASPRRCSTAGWPRDLRFRNTWLRQRHDLKDQSQSGYDLALADFGVDAGLSEQQIVDLIIHHRSPTRGRSEPAWTTSRRTIAKAIPAQIGPGRTRGSARRGAASRRHDRPGCATGRARCAGGQAGD